MLGKAQKEKKATIPARRKKSANIISPLWTSCGLACQFRNTGSSKHKGNSYSLACSFPWVSTRCPHKILAAEQGTAESPFLWHRCAREDRLPLQNKHTTVPPCPNSPPIWGKGLKPLGEATIHCFWGWDRCKNCLPHGKVRKLSQAQNLTPV